MFKSEADIDAYLTARFLNDNKNTGDVCLAEYCNVLQCDKYYESLSSEAASSTREKDYVAKARGAHTTAHCYALAKTCFPERTGNAMQEKNARRFESVFCDTFIGLRTYANKNTGIPVNNNDNNASATRVHQTLLFSSYPPFSYSLASYFISSLCSTTIARAGRICKREGDDQPHQRKRVHSNISRLIFYTAR